MNRTVVMAWALLWRQTEDSLDGAHERILFFSYEPHRGLFQTRKEAREYANKNYGYIARRPDLRRAPHGWRSLAVIRVKVSVEEA